MSSDLFRRSPRGASPPASVRPSSPCGGQCHVTLPLVAFHRFLREVTRLGRSLRIRVVRGFTRPVDLLRLLFGEDRDPSGALSRMLFLLPRDGALHVGQRFLALERKDDRTRVWIFASGFAVRGPRRRGDVATLFPFGEERARYLKASDLDDCLATLRRMVAADPEDFIPFRGTGGGEAATSDAEPFPVPEMR